MHVGLNLVFMVPGETGGTETYARELLTHLAEEPAGPAITAFINSETSQHPPDWLADTPRVTVPVKARNRLGWVFGEQVLLPRLAAEHGVDLLHSLANTAPAWGAYRRVVTIHDLHYRQVPEAHLGVYGLGMRLLVPLAGRTAHRVITDSRATAADISALLNIPGSKIDTIPLGTQAPTQAALPEAEVRARVQAGPRPIVLSVAAKRPHKNLARLIAAVALIPEDRRPLLVVPGYGTPYLRELEAEITRLGVASSVLLLEWVDAAMLEGLYEAAACVVCPSLHEGFGLPVLEAMVRGVPVACSSAGALSEVAGDAALRFDPFSVEQISAAIDRLIQDASAADRLRELGRARAAGFTWQATTAATLASYKAALSGSR